VVAHCVVEPFAGNYTVTLSNSCQKYPSLAGSLVVVDSAVAAVVDSLTAECFAAVESPTADSSAAWCAKDWELE
jgi:hypothetical protein